MEREVFFMEQAQKELLKKKLDFRDRVKSSEYHFAAEFEFDGFFDDFLLERLFKKISELSESIEFTSFKIGVAWPSSSDDAEKSHLRFAVQTPLLKKIEAELGKKTDFEKPDVEFLLDFNKKLVCVRIYPVFVKGRYCKFSRSIAQTEFFCRKCRGKGCSYCNNTGHLSKESVEELIGGVLVPFFGAQLLVLHGAGREDMDVLMLGNGRPFVAELVIPRKRSADLRKIEEGINSSLKGKISINSLELCLQQDVAPLKDSPHEKIYSATVSAERSVDLSLLKKGEEMDVLQRTPLRVAKRRADLERKKTVSVISATQISSKEFVLVLRTSHGTYVKEFVSGDEARTNPSISSLLGVRCTCMQLDVMEVC